MTHTTTDLLLTLRAIHAEKAKGELRAMLCTFVATTEEPGISTDFTESAVKIGEFIDWLESEAPGIA